MKRLVAVIIIIALIGGGVYWWMKTRGNGKTTAYETSPVVVSDITSSVTATGTLAAVTAIKVGSEVSGVIQTIYVKHNSLVKKGQLLAQINPETLQAQVDMAKANLQKSQSSLANSIAQAENARATVKQAQANLASSRAKALQAQAAVDNSRANVLNSQAAVKTAEANLRKSRAELANYKISYERALSLRRQDLIAQNELDNATAVYRAAQASTEALENSLAGSRASLQGAQASLQSAMINVDAVQADAQASQMAVEAALTKLTSAQATVSGSRAEVQQSQANLNSAQVDIKKTSIRSPIDGVVLSVLISEGQTVAAQFSAPELFVLAQNLNQMQVETSVDEADVGLVHEGDAATFTVDAWPDDTFTGTVAEVRNSSSTTNNVVTYPIIVHTTNPNLRLMPGMTATVSITIDESKGVKTVPNTALRFKPADDVTIDEADPEASSSPDEASPTGKPSTSAKSSPSGKHSPEASDDSEDSHIKTVYTEVPNEPKHVMAHKVRVGLSDGTNTELTETDLSEGQEVIVGSTEIPKDKSHGPRGPF